MSRHIFVVALSLVLICPAHAEELTALILPKNNKTIVCATASEGLSSSVMCEPKENDKNISLIDQPNSLLEENITPPTQVSPAENQIKPEEILPPKQKKHKNKSKRKAKTIPKISRSSKPKLNTIYESKTIAENKIEAFEQNPEFPPIGAKIKTFEYTIEEGDTFNTIIQKHFSENIQPGQKIIVMAKPNEVVEAPQQEVIDQLKPNTIEYTVRRGDTLSSILRKYFNGNIYGKNSPFEKLLELNKNIKVSDTIHHGQKIIIPAPIEASNADTDSLLQNKLNIFLTYKFNYISVSDSVSRDVLNFNTDYDLEAGLEYEKQISTRNYFLSSIGISDFSMPRSTLSPSIVLEPTKKTQGLVAIGFKHQLTDDNSLGLHLKYRPYYFLTNLKLEYVSAPSIGLTYENYFYHENQTLLGFGLLAETIGKQDYPLFKSENGSTLSFNFYYRQEFPANDWLNIEFIFLQREQASTYYKINDKNAGLKFSYSLNF